MRLVADESCDFSVVVGVRAAGHDVTSITDVRRQRRKGHRARRVRRRLLLTEDKDFGQLVFAAAKETRASY